MFVKAGSRPVPDAPAYQLIEKIGAGAFGEVWRASAPGGIEVALKFIPLDSAERAETELRSVEVMKSIRHPNLVSLFGAWHKDNWLILAMELCDRSLQDRLAEVLSQQPLMPVDELFSYIRDAAAGLDALNARQIQHRDVKPANLLLVGSGVKVGDFGLAKVLEHTVGHTGTGTLGYMAPECYTGKLSEQSDQYSLAATYYHLRTGKRLYNGTHAEVMYAQLASQPDLSSLPQDEAAVLRRALSRNPDDRWPSCSAFLNGMLAARRAWHAELLRQEAMQIQQKNVCQVSSVNHTSQGTLNQRSIPLDPWLDEWSHAIGYSIALLVFLGIGYLILIDNGVHGGHWLLALVCCALGEYAVFGVAWVRREWAQLTRQRK